MSGAWRTLSDGRKVIIEGAAESIRATWPQKELNPEKLLSNYAPSARSTGPQMVQSGCYWCGAPIYFIKPSNGGCFLADSLPPPNWEIHSCWLEHKRSGRSNRFIIAHYEALGMKPLETILDIVSPISDDNDISSKILAVYDLKLLFDGTRYSIIKVSDHNGRRISCAIQTSVLTQLQRKILHQFRVSSFSYGKRQIRYISAVSGAHSINSAIDTYIGVINIDKP